MLSPSRTPNESPSFSPRAIPRLQTLAQSLPSFSTGIHSGPHTNARNSNPFMHLLHNSLYTPGVLPSFQPALRRLGLSTRATSLSPLSATLTENTEAPPPTPIPATHSQLFTTHFLLGNPQDLVLVLLRAACQRLQLLQPTHAPTRQKRQEAQLPRLQRLMRIQQ